MQNRLTQLVTKSACIPCQLEGVRTISRGFAEGRCAQVAVEVKYRDSTFLIGHSDTQRYQFLIGPPEYPRARMEVVVVEEEEDSTVGVE